jgi:hypothetical protein
MREPSTPAAPSQLLRPELALRALGAIESQLRWLVVGQESGEAILVIWPPHQTALSANRNESLLGLHTLSLGQPIRTESHEVFYSPGEESPEKKTPSSSAPGR